jgi:hypothetical protein
MLGVDLDGVKLSFDFVNHNISSCKDSIDKSKCRLKTIFYPK